MHEKILELGLESPFDDKWFERPSQDERITTSIDLTGYMSVGRNALIAHATQVDPTGWFFTIPRDLQREVWPTEDYQLARSLVETSIPEDDLFAGVRADARAGR
jgi:mycothiol S-conjugate amidase